MIILPLLVEQASASATQRARQKELNKAIKHLKKAQALGLSVNVTLSIEDRAKLRELLK